MKNLFKDSSLTNVLSVAFALAILLVIVSLIKIYIINYLARKYYKHEDILKTSTLKDIMYSVIDIILFTIIIRSFLCPSAL